MAGKSFRKGIGIIELLEMFPDDDAAQEWFKSIRWTQWPDLRQVRQRAHAGSPQRQADALPAFRLPLVQYFKAKPGTVIESSIPPPITMISDSAIQHSPRGSHYTAAGRQPFNTQPPVNPLFGVAPFLGARRRFIVPPCSFLRLDLLTGMTFAG